MHGSGFTSAKKVPRSFFTVVPNGLARYPDPHPLQILNGKGSIRVRTLSYDCAEVTTSRNHKYHELWKCLTSHCEITISREHSQHFLLKGTKLEHRAYVMQNARECVRKT